MSAMCDGLYSMIRLTMSKSQSNWPNPKFNLIHTFCFVLLSEKSRQQYGYTALLDELSWFEWPLMNDGNLDVSTFDLEVMIARTLDYNVIPETPVAPVIEFQIQRDVIDNSQVYLWVNHNFSFSCNSIIFLNNIINQQKMHLKIEIVLSALTPL